MCKRVLAALQALVSGIGKRIESEKEIKFGFNFNVFLPILNAAQEE